MIIHIAAHTFLTLVFLSLFNQKKALKVNLKQLILHFNKNGLDALLNAGMCLKKSHTGFQAIGLNFPMAKVVDWESAQFKNHFSMISGKF